MEDHNQEEPSLWNYLVTLFKPMRKIGDGFYDPIGAEKVDKYVDYQGKAWLATGPRDLLRVRTPKYDEPYKVIKKTNE